MPSHQQRRHSHHAANSSTNGGEAHTSAKPAPGKKKKQRDPRCTSFIIATAAFVLFLAVWYGFFEMNTQGGSGADAEPLVPIAPTDVAALEDAVSKVQSSLSVSNFIDMIESTMHMGCAIEQIFHKMIEKEDEQGTQAYLDNARLTSAVRSLRRASHVTYTKLSGMLRLDPDAGLPYVATSLMRTLFSWVAVSVHAHQVVMAEYYLQKDDSRLHAISLLRSLNMLSWSANIDGLFNWSTSPCHKALSGTSSEWIKFCESSMGTQQANRLRRAASLEELIVLFPMYAPFRLHYLSTISFTRDARVSAEQVLRQIRHNREKLSSLNHVDTFHTDILTLAEFYLSPADTVDEVQNLNVLKAMVSKDFNTCEKLMRPLDMPELWPGSFQMELRPHLVDRQQARDIVTKLKLWLPQGDFDALNYTGCS